MDVGKLRLLNAIVGWSVLVVSACCCGCAAKSLRSLEKHVFVNGYGDSISLTDSCTFVAGKYYLAESCSTEHIRCEKYGSLFAIMVPFLCHDIGDYRWSGNGVDSFLMALTPHDSNDVLLSTTYGGWISFSYEASSGVTELYYDPLAKLGVKENWFWSDSIDLEKIRYKKIGSLKFMPCSIK